MSADAPELAPHALLVPGALRGRVALVTGAGRNIGRAIAIALADAGATVAVNVRQNREEGKQTLKELKDRGGGGMLVVGDISESATVNSMIAQIRETLGPLTVLVNNVGVRPRQALADITDEDWHYVLDAGLGGAFYCARAASKDMIDQRWGRIISLSGRDGFTGLSNRAHGVTTKAAVHGLTKALALELGPSGITANTIVPGYINTHRPREWYPDHNHVARVSNIPVGRGGHVQDIANLSVFLAVYGSYINGQALHINGGEFLIG